MSEHYQTIADLDADSHTSEEDAHRIREWLVSERIIVRNTTDCVLSNLHGHMPGENYIVAVKKPYPQLFELRTNGVALISKRTVFYSAGNPLILVCLSCGERFEGKESWSAAVQEWFTAKGPGLLACERCGVSVPITEWQHDPPWAFGHVGIEFWNWPPLREEFVKKAGEVLRHRVRLVYGRY